MDKRKRKRKKDINKFDKFTTEFDVMRSNHHFNFQPTNVFHPVSCPNEIQANFDKTDFCQHISSLLVDSKDKEEVRFKELFSVKDLYSSNALDEALNWCSYEGQQLDWFDYVNINSVDLNFTHHIHSIDVHENEFNGFNTNDDFLVHLLLNGIDEWNH